MSRTDGVALATARRRKEWTFAELMWLNRRARLVVLAIDVGGRWSHETRTFISQLAKARVRGDTPLMRKRSEQAWRGSILACAVARAVGSKMLEHPGARGSDGHTPARQDVQQDSRFGGLVC